MTMIRHSMLMVIVSLTSLATEAADKTSKVDRVVDAVLEQEVRSDVSRRADHLGDLVGESDRARWAAGYIRTGDGWQSFDALPRMDDRLRDYEQRRGTETLTPDQHLQLANWCREQKLHPQERAHLWSLVSDQKLGVTAVQRLGYENQDGGWRTKEEQAELLNKEQTWFRAYRKWLPRAQSIQKLLAQDETSGRAKGRAQLALITETEAIPALEMSLGYTSVEEANELIQYLAKDHRTAFTLALMRQSILSPWDSTRAMAGDCLRNRRPDSYVPTLLSTAMKPLDLDVKHRVVHLRSGFDQSRGGMRYENLLLTQITAKSETRDTTPVFVLNRVVPIVIYGQRGIGSLAPDFYADGLTGQLKRHPGAINQLKLDPDNGSLHSDVDSEVGWFNAEIQRWNQRVSQTLTRAADFPANQTLDQVWREWSRQTFTEANASKPVVVQSTQIEVAERPLIGFDRLNTSCLPAGTLIKTSNGSRPIEIIQIGDTVLAKDVETGELSYKPVVRTTVRSPQPLVTLHTKDDSIRATLGHYFWVSGKGWRMAKEIKPGDRLHGVQGTVTVTDVGRGGREAVYNLVVDGASTYFVGEGKILSHDVTPPVPTDIVVPGLAAR